MPFLKVLATLGHGFNENRYVTIIWIVLPVIGLLERYGLQERARTLIARNARRDDGPAADRLSRLPPDPRGARPDLGRRPCADGAAAGRADGASPRRRSSTASSTKTPTERVKAMSAATDNVGLFFGEDIFLAIASILLIQGSLASFGIQLTPFQLSVWAIPSAICAFLIHGARLLLLDRQLGRRQMINLHWLYVLAGAVFAGFAIGSARDETNPKRWGNAAFWGLLAVSFWFGDFLGDIGNGVLVLALVAIAGVAPARPRIEGSRRRRASASASPSATATGCSCRR